MSAGCVSAIALMVVVLIACGALGTLSLCRAAKAGDAQLYHDEADFLWHALRESDEQDRA